MPDDIDVIGAAIAATENEIFGDAFDRKDNELDESGDRSIEQMGEGLEGQNEDDDDETEVEASDTEESEGTEEKDAKSGDDKTGEVKPKSAEADAKPKGGVKPAEQPEGRVPPGRLREANEKPRTAEARNAELTTQIETERVQSRKDIEALSTRLDGLIAAIARRSDPDKTADKPQAETAPDLFEDPKGFVDGLKKGFQSEVATLQQQLGNQRVETSMAIAHALQKDVFERAFAAVGKLDRNNPDDQTVVRRIYSSANPGQALIEWHRRNETLREVGEDPVKDRGRVAVDARETVVKDPEFRKQLIAELRTEATGNGNTVFRAPKSLNGASGGRSARDVDPNAGDDSDSAVFESAFR